MNLNVHSYSFMIEICKRLEKPMDLIVYFFISRVIGKLLLF